MLLSEHRAAPAASTQTLELVTTDATTTHLGVVACPSDRLHLQEQILLGAAGKRTLPNF